MFSVLQNQVNVTDIVNTSSVSFFVIITTVAKKNSGVVVFQDRIIYMTRKNKRRSTTILEEILLDFHHHVSRLEWLIQEYLFLVEKVIRTNTENSLEVAGLFITSLIHSFSFVYSNSK